MGTLKILHFFTKHIETHRYWRMCCSKGDSLFLWKQMSFIHRGYIYTHTYTRNLFQANRNVEKHLSSSHSANLPPKSRAVGLRVLRYISVCIFFVAGDSCLLLLKDYLRLVCHPLSFSAIWGLQRRGSVRPLPPLRSSHFHQLSKRTLVIERLWPEGYPASSQWLGPELLEEEEAFHKVGDKMKITRVKSK